MSFDFIRIQQITLDASSKQAGEFSLQLTVFMQADLTAG